MKGLRGFILALAGALAFGAPAQAAPITLVGGTAGSIPGGEATNDFIPELFPGPTIGGFYGAQIIVSFSVPSSVSFEFLGADALYRNEFDFFDNRRFAHSGTLIREIAPSLGTPLGSFLAQIVGSGQLPFGFWVNGDAGRVSNGSNPDDSSGGAGGSPNFFATCNPFSGDAGAGGRDCNSVFIFLDDGAAGPDNDHDDLVMRITVPDPGTPGVPEPGTFAVPEPATLGLLGLGLLGLAGRRLRASRRSRPL